jgi:hypothetical protein
MIPKKSHRLIATRVEMAGGSPGASRRVELQSLPFNTLRHSEVKRDATVSTNLTTIARWAVVTYLPLPSISIALRLASLSPWM